MQPAGVAGCAHGPAANAHAGSRLCESCRAAGPTTAVALPRQAVARPCQAPARAGTRSCLALHPWLHVPLEGTAKLTTIPPMVPSTAAQAGAAHHGLQALQPRPPHALRRADEVHAAVHQLLQARRELVGQVAQGLQGGWGDRLGGGCFVFALWVCCRVGWGVTVGARVEEKG